MHEPAACTPSDFLTTCTGSPCVSGQCACDPGWGGAFCSELRLLPVNAARIGYRRALPDGPGGAAQNVSSCPSTCHVAFKLRYDTTFGEASLRGVVPPSGYIFIDL